MDTGFGQDRQMRMARENVQRRWTSAYAPLRHLDPVLIVTSLLLTGVGLVAIYSARWHMLTSQGRPTTEYLSRQLIAFALGVVALVVASLIDYRKLQSYATVLYGGSVALLVL